MKHLQSPHFSVRKAAMLTLAVVAITAAFFSGYVVSRLTTQKTLGSDTNVVSTVNLSLYDNDGVNLTSIHWGIILPGQSLTYAVWVENDAAVALNISITTRDWSPSGAQGNFTFAVSEIDVNSPGHYTWQNQGFGTYPVLDPHKRAPTYLTLTAGQNATDSAIAFTIVFQGDSI